jgi:hypothetical protein
MQIMLLIINKLGCEFFELLLQNKCELRKGVKAQLKLT